MSAGISGNYFGCKLCCIRGAPFKQETLNAHLQTVGHKFMKTLYENGIWPEPMDKPHVYLQKPNNAYKFIDLQGTVLCEPCNKVLPGPLSLFGHQLEENHRAKVSAQLLDVPVVYHCEDCQMMLCGLESYYNHCWSKSHNDIVERNNQLKAEEAEKNAKNKEADEKSQKSDGNSGHSKDKKDSKSSDKDKKSTNEKSKHSSSSRDQSSSRHSKSSRDKKDDHKSKEKQESESELKNPADEKQQTGGSLSYEQTLQSLFQQFQQEPPKQGLTAKLLAQSQEQTQTSSTESAGSKSANWSIENLQESPAVANLLKLLQEKSKSVSTIDALSSTGRPEVKAGALSNVPVTNLGHLPTAFDPSIPPPPLAAPVINVGNLPTNTSNSATVELVKAALEKFKHLNKAQNPSDDGNSPPEAKRPKLDKRLDIKNFPLANQVAAILSKSQTVVQTDKKESAVIEEAKTTEKSEPPKAGPSSKIAEMVKELGKKQMQSPLTQDNSVVSTFIENAPSLMNVPQFSEKFHQFLMENAQMFPQISSAIKKSQENQKRQEEIKEAEKLAEKFKPYLEEERERVKKEVEKLAELDQLYNSLINFGSTNDSEFADPDSKIADQNRPNFQSLLDKYNKLVAIKLIDTNQSENASDKKSAEAKLKSSKEVTSSSDYPKPKEDLSKSKEESKSKEDSSKHKDEPPKKISSSSSSRYSHKRYGSKSRSSDNAKKSESSKKSTESNKRPEELKKNEITKKYDNPVQSREKQEKQQNLGLPSEKGEDSTAVPATPMNDALRLLLGKLSNRQQQQQPEAPYNGPVLAANAQYPTSLHDENPAPVSDASKERLRQLLSKIQAVLPNTKPSLIKEPLLKDFPSMMMTHREPLIKPFPPTMTHKEPLLKNFLPTMNYVPPTQQREMNFRQPMDISTIPLPSDHRIGQNERDESKNVQVESISMSPSPSPPPASQTSAKVFTLEQIRAERQTRYNFDDMRYPDS